MYVFMFPTQLAFYLKALQITLPFKSNWKEGIKPRIDLS